MSEDNPHAEIESEIAESLRLADSSGQPVDAVRDATEDVSIEAAYRIQEINTRKRVEAGGRIVGRKIGLTSKIVQEQLGVDTPDFGTLFADMAIGDGESVDHSQLISPKIEGEIGFVLGSDIDLVDATASDIVAATDYITPVMEIVDSRIRDWDITIFDTVADNASAARFVAGGMKCSLDGIEVSSLGMEMSVNGETVSSGTGRDCLGNPINAVVWLARQLAAMGTKLQAGDILLSGAMGPMVPASAGDEVSLSIDGLGTIRVSFD